MGTRNLVARVRDLVARAETGSLDPNELAAHASLLEELKARIERLRALGAEIELSAEVLGLMARLAPTAVAA